MSWAGWRPASPGAQPPATVADSAWQPLADAEFGFHTAAEDIATGTSPPAVPLSGEQTFDPRAVARYLIGLEPDGASAAPHLLGDALVARFQVDHVEQLLAAYGRTLVLEIRRTDPPPGSVVPGPLPVIPVEIDRRALEPEHLDKVDARVIGALRARPRCLATDVNTGGVALAIHADLEPDAEYDLLLKADAPDPPLGAGTPDLLIARSHWRSSRYADVAPMLAHLGFGVAANTPFVPFDFITAAAAMPAADALASDAALDDALRTLGMDPWPVVGFARTVAIWCAGATAGSYLLAGLLLEGPEPIERGTRCGVAEARVTGEKGDLLLTLVPCRINSAGTRVLLASTDPAGQALQGDDLTLALQLRDGAATTTGTRTLRALPRIAYQELP